MSQVSPTENITGSTEVPTRHVRCRFGRYEVTVRVGPNGEFVGVVAVGVKRDFLSPTQRAAAFGAHDVSDLYAKD